MGESLSRLADGDGRIIGITAAMSSGTGMDVFAAAHPDRFFDVGIAEGHAVSMAGGMAKQGMVPVFAVYSSFLQRGYDMLIHDVALQICMLFSALTEPDLSAATVRLITAYLTSAISARFPI